jgi:hypothetical protein
MLTVQCQAQAEVEESVEMTIHTGEDEGVSVPVTVFVSAPDFDIDPRVQQAYLYDPITCTLTPQHQGRHIVEVEVFYRTLRVFYVVQEVNVCASY